MPGAFERGAHQLGGQTIARQARIGKGRPDIGGDAQCLGRDARGGEQQGEQGKTTTSSHAQASENRFGQRKAQDCTKFSAATRRIGYVRTCFFFALAVTPAPRRHRMRQDG
ncbi:hypothetical protein D9M70_622190 [compost metagenome]